MITTSTAETVDYTPPWFDTPGNSDKSPPKFFLRAGSVIERGQMEAELAGKYQSGQVYGYELRAAILGGVQKLLAEDPELDRVLALLEVEAEEIASAGSDDTVEPGDTDGATEGTPDKKPGEGPTSKLSDEERQLLDEVRKVLAEHWPPYRELVEQLERRREIAPIVALRRFCTGWENVTNDKNKAVPFTRNRDGVTDAALGQIKRLELMVAGNRAYALQYAAGQEGN